MNIYKDAFLSTFNLIRSKKRLFLVLFFIQIILLIATFGFLLTYQLAIFEDLQAINAPLQDISDASTQELLEQSLELSLAYKSMIKHILSLLGILVLLYFTLNAVLWLLSHYMFLGKKKDLFSYFKKYVLTTLTLILPLALIYYILFVKAVNIGIDQFSQTFKSLSYFSLALMYVLLVALTLLTIKERKAYTKSILHVAFKKIHYTLLAVLIIIALLALCVYFFIFASLGEGSFALIILSTLLFVFVYVFARLYLIALTHKIKVR